MRGAACSSAVSLLLVDEASRVTNDLCLAVGPMLEVSWGTLWLMSTPCGKRGFFWETWEQRVGVWDAAFDVGGVLEYSRERGHQRCMFGGTVTDRWGRCTGADLSIPILSSAHPQRGRLSETRQLKRLTIVHAPVNDLKAQGFVAGLREFVVDPCIRRHFDASVGSGPIFCGRKKSAADPAVPNLLGDVPALQITHRSRRIATIGVRAQVDFSKAEESAIGSLRNEVD